MCVETSSEVSELDIYWLVVWNMFLFFHIFGIIIPIDEYFSEGVKPPTSIKTLKTMFFFGGKMGRNHLNL